MKLKDPKMKFFLLFLAEVLKPLEEFELLFQNEKTQIHILHSRLMELMKRWLLRFIKPAKLTHKLWKLDLEDSSAWLPPYEIAVGEPARRLFADLSVSDQQACLSSMKSFFKAGTLKLNAYLPFGNCFLRACQMLDPEKQENPSYIRWVGILARKLPTVISETEIGSLEVEARLHQQEISEGPSENMNNVAEFWSNVDQRRNRPILIRLVRALLVMPHGNAEVERIFSTLRDTISKKRLRLKPATVKALMVSRSCILSQKWTLATIPVTSSLLNLCNNASASYRRRMREEMEAEEKRKMKELETSLFIEVCSEKEASEHYTSLNEKVQEKEKEIERKIKENEEACQLMEEARKNVETQRNEIERLRQEEKRLRNKREAESEAAAKRVLKRKALELTMAKPTSQLPKIQRK